MTQNNLKIAITGGIGSGKSTVCKIIMEEGYAVISCDEIYKDLLTDKHFLSMLAKEFSGIILSDGTLDRKKLSEIVFNDSVALQKLNALTHPAIMEEVFKAASANTVTFCEVPLLFENSLERFFDKVIVVLRDKGQRVESVIKRDNIARNKVLLRLNSQFDYENADLTEYYVIHNNADYADLKLKTLEILSEITK